MSDLCASLEFINVFALKLFACFVVLLVVVAVVSSCFKMTDIFKDKEIASS